MEAVAAGDEVAAQFVRRPVMLQANHRRRLEIIDRHLFCIEVDRAAGRQARVDKVADYLVLSVNGDALAAGELREIDAMTFSRKLIHTPE